MFREIDNVLIGRGRISDRVREIAAEMSRDLTEAVRAEGTETTEDRVVFLPIMTGAIVFVADLIREMPLKISLNLVAVSSYPGRSMESKGAQIASDLPDTLSGKHVVIIDDILDSGRTLKLVKRLVEERGPASVRTAVLLDKTSRRVEDISADYVGFEIPDEFVVGYGLDFDGYYRNVPDIATLSPDAIGEPVDDPVAERGGDAMGNPGTGG